MALARAAPSRVPTQRSAIRLCRTDIRTSSKWRGARRAAPRAPPPPRGAANVLVRRHRASLLGLVVPGAVLDLDHDAGALVETEMVGRRHVEDAVRAVDLARRLERIAQGGAE